MLADTIGVSLLENMIADERVIIRNDGVIQASEGVIRAGQYS